MYAVYGMVKHITVWIGMKEQSDMYEGKPLSDLCDFEELSLSDISPDDVDKYAKQIDIFMD